MGERPDKLPVQVFSARRLFDTPFMRIDESRLSYRRRNGAWSEAITRLNVDRGDSVAAILHDPALGRLYFTWQFRFSTYDFGDEPDPANGWLLELVAGSVKPGEPLRDSIAREVMEETGFVIGRLEMIGSFYLTPGASSERLYLFYAEVSEANRAPAEPGHDDGTFGVEDEQIEVVSMTVPEFLACVESLRIADAKTIAAAEWLRRQR
jgi:ADP-ribose pyrophosphatase